MWNLVGSGSGRIRRGVLWVLILILGLSGIGFAGPDSLLDGPGDPRDGYDRPDFLTRTLSLQTRTGIPADLLGRARDGALGLPAVGALEDNPLTEERVKLGRKLFFDRRLSLNGTQSCAMCHIPEQGFTNNELATAVGLEGRSVGRNTPSLYNVGYMERLFRDGREESLEQQAWQPILDRNEMANPSIGFVLRRLESLSDYDGMFESAFDGSGPDISNVPKALAAYQRTLVSGNSAFDRWYYADDKNALSDEEVRGFEVFTGRGNCVSCHTIQDEYALFTDQKMHNTGVGYARSQEKGSGSTRVQLAPGVFVDVSDEIIRTVGGRIPPDLGRSRVTGDPEDRWRFVTPSLRNVALTRPYMHDGSLGTLTEVVDFYDGGGVPNPLQDERIQPLGLSEQERADLVAFLQALTGEYRELVLDGFAAPRGGAGVEKLRSSPELE